MPMECGLIHPLDYGEFSRIIHKDAAKKRIPIGGGIEPTFRCNLNCVHCYATCESRGSRTELSFQEICRILDELAEEGCLWLLITGGEPLLRRDFLDIYTFAKKKGFIVTVFTNGTLINEEVVSCFKELRPFNIEITLYGATAETYEKVTRTSRSFERCMRGIDLLLEKKLPLRLKSIIMTVNQHEVGKLRKFSEARGMPFLLDPILSPTLRQNREPCSYRLSPKDVLRLDESDPDRANGWREYFEDFAGKPESDHLYICGAGETSFFVNAYGELQLCVLSRVPSYSLRKGSFKEGWYGFFGQVCDQRVRKDYRCRKCDLISICGQCPGWSFLEHGNWDTPVEYLCEIAHLRAQAFQKK